MSHITWNDSFEIGVDFLDKEHQQLFSTMNKLITLSESKEKSEWVCREGIKYIKSHVENHFVHEEDYMQSIQYGGYEVHKHLHDDFRYHTLPALEKELEETRYSEDSVRHFLGVCIGWLISHTLTEDLAIAGKTVSHWKDIQQGMELDALETTIVQLIQEMFRLNARLISGQYAGEDFGNIFCCRLTYGGEKKERWEFTLIYEDRLLLKLINNILNVEYPRVDDMVLNVTRYLSRQFLEQIQESFTEMGVLDLENECLLSQEQLLKSFEREKPSCSLLFSTGHGYFGFIAASAGTASSTMTTVNHQNAMNAVKEYLVREREEQEKRRGKILVVDDSDFILSRMRMLLSDTYDLVESHSSISAIKKIVLNRPDLVLLDYEMPICDGQQMLEMIRSDKDISDVPVIFLTGRDDKESVRKVRSLKPAGYLLKTMPDEFIRKNVDLFFEQKGGNSIDGRKELS